MQTPKANVQSSHATEVSQLKYKEALAKVEQLEFENALLKQKLKEWEQWRESANVGKKVLSEFTVNCGNIAN